MQQAAAIELQEVSKAYRRQAPQTLSTTLKSFVLQDMWQRRRRPQAGLLWALQEVSLRIDPGTTVGVIGRNGSGKSTLLKLVSRILRPDRGLLQVRGHVAALIELGAGFHPELTGRENVLVNGVILGLSRAQVRERMPDIVAFADIGDAIDYPVRTYSSGMYARLGFAVAVHVEPDILLVDEVLSVGDASFTRKCGVALERFKQQNRAIVVVSHDLNTVRNFCELAIWLDAGRVKHQGPAAEVIDAYNDSIN